MSQQKSTGKIPGKRSSIVEGLSASALPQESGAVWAGRETAPPDTPNEFTAFVDVLESDMEGEPSPAPMPVREGLPPSYRMRADRHYVELLDRPLAPAESSPRESAAFAEVSRALAAAEACVALTSQPRGLLSLAAKDVLKAEMARASALLQLTRYIKGDVTAVKGTVSSHALVQRIVRTSDAERRLRGISVVAREDVTDIRFASDETLLGHALLAQLLATFTLLEGVEQPQVSLAAAVNDAGEVVLSIAQDRVAAPQRWTARPVGESWIDDDAGILAAIAMSAAQRLAQAQGGRFTVNTGDRSTRLTLHLPALQAPTTPPAVV